jgi:hypothetical protein
MVAMRWGVLTVLTLVMGVVDSRAQNYPAPGFDCASVSTPQELRICRSPQLSGLDGLHWFLAERAIKGSKDPERTRADVEGWITHVRNACDTDACLTAAYHARNAELERAVATLAPPRVPPMLSAPPGPPPAPAQPQVGVAPPAPVVIPPAVPSPVTRPQPAAPRPAAVPAPEDDSSPLWPWLVGAGLVLVALLAKR